MTARLNIDRLQLAALASVDRALAWRCPLVCLDLELTGLEHDASITEVAAIWLAPDLSEVERMHALVDPGREQSDAHPWVREHTRWGAAGSREHWRDLGAVAPALALERLGGMLQRASLISAGRLGLLGHALALVDVPSLLVAWGRREHRHLWPAWRAWLADGSWRRYSIDTHDLAAPLLAQGLVKSRSLADCAAALGIAHHPHCALSDAVATAEVARRLLCARV